MLNNVPAWYQIGTSYQTAGWVLVVQDLLTSCSTKLNQFMSGQPDVIAAEWMWWDGNQYQREPLSLAHLISNMALGTRSSTRKQNCLPACTSIGFSGAAARCT